MTFLFWNFILLLLTIDVVISASVCSGVVVDSTYCLSFHNVNMTWDQAEQMCAQLEGQVVDVYDSSMQNSVEKLMRNNQGSTAWLGAGKAIKANTPGLWRWLNGKLLKGQGCYNEKSVSDMENKVLENDPDMTPQKCIDKCASQYQYAATQSGDTCFCDNKFGRYNTSDTCTVHCRGDNTMYCGGWYEHFVYAIGGHYGEWGYNQPNNFDGFQNCGALDHYNEYKLADEACDKPLRFLCQRSTDVGNCAGTSGYYFKIDVYCFYLSYSYNRVTWMDAKRECALRQATLAVIDSQDLSQKLQNKLKSYSTNDRHTWLGLSKKEWQWDNEKPLIYNKFAADEPKPYDDYCVYIAKIGLDFEWKTTPCSRKLYFICQVDYRSTSTSTTTTTTTTTTPSTIAETTTSTTTTTPSTIADTTITPSPTTTPKKTKKTKQTEATTSVTEPVTSEASRTATSTVKVGAVTNPTDNVTALQIALIVLCILLVLAILAIIIIFAVYQRSSCAKDHQVKPYKRYHTPRHNQVAETSSISSSSTDSTFDNSYSGYYLANPMNSREQYSTGQTSQTSQTRDFATQTARRQGSLRTSVFRLPPHEQRASIRL